MQFTSPEPQTPAAPLTEPVVKSEPLTVFIAGSGRSGSTLLDMCLGGHSRISALGETGFLYFYARQTTSRDLCTCGLGLGQCPFWRKVEEPLKASGVSGFGDLPLSDPARIRLDDQGHYRERLPGEGNANASLLRHVSIVLGSGLFFKLAAHLSPAVRINYAAAQNRHRLYAAVRKAHGTPVIVDSTKTAGAVKEAFMISPQPARIIMLYRDGRAVSASHKRRLGLSMTQAAHFWKSEMVKWQAAQATIPRSAILTVRYEDFTARPQAELDRICRFLGLDFEPGLLDFRKDRHNIGGNPMRFRADEVEIRPDSRWRDEVTAQDLADFEAEAGDFNRALGYLA